MLRDDEFTAEEHYNFRRSLEEYNLEQNKKIKINLSINSEDGIYEVASKDLNIVDGRCELVLKRK